MAGFGRRHCLLHAAPCDLHGKLGHLRTETVAQVPVLARMFEKRLRTYRAIGYARGEAPLGFAKPPEAAIVEYDPEALHAFREDV